jgi:hypothetical protein
MTDRRSRRWFQLSLKALFRLVLLVATFFAGYTLAERQAREAMRAEQEANRLEAVRAESNVKVQQGVWSFYIGLSR